MSIFDMRDRDPEGEVLVPADVIEEITDPKAFEEELLAAKKLSNTSDEEMFPVQPDTAEEDSLSAEQIDQMIELLRRGNEALEEINATLAEMNERLSSTLGRVRPRGLQVPPDCMLSGARQQVFAVSPDFMMGEASY